MPTCLGALAGLIERLNGNPDVNSAPSDQTFDIIVLGGGSAGCVLASRLSENPATKVLLVEAGQDLLPEAVPAVIASAYPGRAYFDQDWTWPGLRATMGGGAAQANGDPSRFYEQARILGGGSSINGIGANRGAPGDYDEWEALGAKGWSWGDVLPYFRKLERDLDFGDNPIHGTEGPVPVRRLQRSDHSNFIREVEAQLNADGYTRHEDQNGEWLDGLYPIATNLDEDNKRASTAVTYLSHSVRARHNLTIWTRTTADRVLMDGNRATGARLMRNGTPLDVRSRNVIVSCGAIHSPALLLRSGIGRPADLSALGIATHVKREGVGQNLQEHPSIGVSAFLGPRGRMPRGEHYHIQAILRWSSGLEGTPQGDMHLSLNARSGWHQVGFRIGTLFGWVNKSTSKGAISLRSPDGSVPPVVDFRLLSDSADLVRLASSFRLAAATLQHLANAGHCDLPFPSTFSDRIKKWLKPSRRNGALMELAGPAMDVSRLIRKRVVQIATADTPPLHMLLANENLLHQYLMQNVGGVWHPCGTCKMGAKDDPLSVCDSHAQVYGTENLYVCDASIMPTIPCANINIPTIMMAEKISDHLKCRSRA